MSVGGPRVATELAQGLPITGVWSAATLQTTRGAGQPFDAQAHQPTYTHDVIGVELCAMIRNVAAIGLGMLDGLGKPTGEDFKNVKGALFTKAAHEIVELVGAAEAPGATLRDLEGRGLTVEGVDSTREVARSADELNLDLPYHAAIHRVLFDGADARDILEVLR